MYFCISIEFDIKIAEMNEHVLPKFKSEMLFFENIQVEFKTFCKGFGGIPTL